MRDLARRIAALFASIYVAVRTAVNTCNRKFARQNPSSELPTNHMPQMPTRTGPAA